MCQQLNRSPQLQQIHYPNQPPLWIVKNIIHKSRGAQVRRKSVRKSRTRRSLKQASRQLLCVQIHPGPSTTGRSSLPISKQLLLRLVNREYLISLHLLSHVKCQNENSALRSNNRKPLLLALMLSLRLKISLDHRSRPWLHQWTNN